MNTDNPIVGVNLTDADKFLCEYVDFLATRIPITTVNNLFVFTARGSYNSLQLDTHKKEGEILINILKSEMDKHLHAYYKNIKSVKNHAAAGLFVESFYHLFNRTDTDFIFVGKDSKSHGMNGKYMIRHIPANTFVVPQKAKNKLDRILITVDTTEHSKHVLKKALEFCSKVTPTPKITVLHVLHWPYFGYLEEAIAENYRLHSDIDLNNEIKEELKIEKKKFKEFVSESAKDFDNLDLKVKVVRVRGKKAYRGVMKYISGHKTDLLIFGSKSHSGFDAHLLGSFAEKVISVNNKVPMLVVK